MPGAPIPGMALDEPASPAALIASYWFVTPGIGPLSSRAAGLQASPRSAVTAKPMCRLRRSFLIGEDMFPSLMTVDKCVRRREVTLPRANICYCLTGMTASSYEGTVRSIICAFQLGHITSHDR